MSHEIEWTEPHRKGVTRHQEGACVKCGKVVYICACTWPGQIDIAGTAVSMECQNG